jgi:MFS family permease
MYLDANHPLAFTIACAKAPSFSALVGFRFLAGLFGSVPMTNGGGTIADMILQEKRGMAMSVFSIGPLLGPIVGPVAGGYLSEALGWRWVFWLLSIISGTVTVLFALFARETYAPVLLKRKAAKLRKETGNNLLRSKLDPGLGSSDFFKRSIIRPCKMLMFSPICVIASVYVGIAYAYLYLMFGSITPLFMQIYGFGPGEAGLSFLGLGVGSMVGVLWFSIMSDKYIKKKAEQERIAAEGEGRIAEGMKPEYRLPPLKIGAFLLPAGLFLYGWTADYGVHWIAPIIGTTVVGVAQLLIFMASAPLPGDDLSEIKLTSYSRSRCTSWIASKSTRRQLWRPTLWCGLSLAR